MEKKQIKAEQAHNPKIDWEEIKNKVSSLQGTHAENGVVSPEFKRKILKARAQCLALENKDNSADEEKLEILEFRLGSETYAIETEFVREVYLLNNFTPLPGVPDFVLGIVNIRGQILSIIDLKKIFNLPTSGIGELNKIIVIQNEKMEFGILTDVILGTRSILLNSVQTSYSSMPGIGAEYLKGVTSDHLIILDAKYILEDEKILINQKIEEIYN